MSIATLIRAAMQRRASRDAAAAANPAPLPAKKPAANAVRREPKAPALKPDPLAEALRQETRRILASTALDCGLSAAQLPGWLARAEKNHEAAREELRLRVELPRLAQETDRRIRAAGRASLVDVDSFTEQCLAEGIGLEEASARLARLEAESGAFPTADYATIYGDGTPEDCRRLAIERAKAPEGSPGHRLAQLLGEDAHRRAILADALVNSVSPVTGRRGRAGDVGREEHAARTVAQLNAEADTMERNWGGQRASAPSAATAPAQPQHLGYFNCDAPPGFLRRRPREEGGSGI